jgi:hypothetical protein
MDLTEAILRGKMDLTEAVLKVKTYLTEAILIPKMSFSEAVYRVRGLFANDRYLIFNAARAGVGNAEDITSPRRDCKAGCRWV